MSNSSALHTEWESRMWWDRRGLNLPTGLSPPL